MNTLIVYAWEEFRGPDEKVWTSAMAVVEGYIAESTLLKYCHQGSRFIPGFVGLAAPTRFLGQMAELTAVATTRQAPTIDMDAADLIAAFEGGHADGWDDDHERVAVVIACGSRIATARPFGEPPASSDTDATPIDPGAAGEAVA